MLAVVLAAGAGACQPAAFRGDPVAASQAGMPAFAGAEGFGRHATGWRGGSVIKVTTLEDRGPGSLRACAEDDRPRVCIFEVAGTIEVDSTIAVGSNVYLAGQTAPGDGVQLRLRHSRQRPLMVHVASDVVIRHLRLRPGPSRTPSSNVDGIGIFDSHDVILDHLSVQYATDELLDIGTLRGSSYDITVQDSLLAWGLDRANHPKGKHSKGALICAMNSRGECGRITLLRNLFAHNRDRNPDVKGTPIGPVEIVNNVFYDPKSQFGEFYDLYGDLRVNYIGNTALSGPSTRRTNAPYAFDIDDFSLAYDVRVYVRDNLDAHRREASEPDELVAPPGDRAWLASGAVSAAHRRADRGRCRAGFRAGQRRRHAAGPGRVGPTGDRGGAQSIRQGHRRPGRGRRLAASPLGARTPGLRRRRHARSMGGRPWHRSAGVRRLE